MIQVGEKQSTAVILEFIAENGLAAAFEFFGAAVMAEFGF
jgi:hypothetical protein